MTLYIEGDRYSKIVRIARKLSKGFSFIRVRFWDGYKTVIYWQRKDYWGKRT